MNDVILEGIVGSTAYGLATEFSDIDKLGIYVAPMVDVLGLDPPREGNTTRTQRDPDRTLHEVWKFCRLALKSNPTILELLWLPQYERATPEGLMLVDHRDSFLSSKYVKDAFLGYATQQFRRIQVRESNDFSSDTKGRTSKHARHLRRLVYQGLQLWTTGTMVLEVDCPQSYFEFGERVQGGDLSEAQALLKWAECEFNPKNTSLPDYPEAHIVNAMLVNIRQHMNLNMSSTFECEGTE